MINDRQMTAQLLAEHGMMPLVRLVAQTFGKPASVAVIAPNGAAYSGMRPFKVNRVATPIGNRLIQRC